VTKTVPVSAPLVLVQGWTRAMTLGAQPNMRLKLAGAALQFQLCPN
jgi:hypothetical protein